MNAKVSAKKLKAFDKCQKNQRWIKIKQFSTFVL